MATAGDRRGAGPERVFHRPLPREGVVKVSPEESRHLVRVRRVREGAEVVLVDGEGTVLSARLVVADPRGADLLVLGVFPARDPARPLALAVSPPEGPRADALVEGLAELGVDRLAPLLCERTPEGREAEVRRRRARWERLALAALKVNGRSRLLRIEAPVRFAAALGEAPPAPFVLDPDPHAPALADLLPPAGPLPRLLVGPEGGFTEEELRLAEERGGRRVRLGPTALRTGTAALAAAALALGR